MIRCWFFGVWSPDSVGHYLYGPGMVRLMYCPAGDWISLDGSYAPGCGTDAVDRLTQPLGVWRRTVVLGCTILGCWDRSADERRNSNAAFIVEGEYRLKWALEIARAAFPVQAGRILTQFDDPRRCECQGEPGGVQ